MADIIKEKLYIDRKTEISKAWWECDETDVANSMVMMVKALEENQRGRKQANLRHAYLYQNRNIDTNSGVDRQIDAVTYNVVKSATDTLTSKITQNRPRPRILTERGDYAKQRRAQKLSQYVDGVLAEAKTYRYGPQVFKDGCIFGTGAIKVIADYENGSICTERVLISEIIVDDVEAAYGAPSSLYQVRLVSKHALAAMFPEKIKVIEQTKPTVTSSADKYQMIEMVRVYEGWHLGKDGRHIMATESGLLMSEPWTLNMFPFAFFRYTSSLTGFYGTGVAEELLGTQLEINKILRDIQRAQKLIAVPRVLLEANSKVMASHLNNDIGSAIKYQGTKPDFFTPTAMNNEIYNHVKWLINSAYEKVGVSQLAASSKKPAGLDSGRALREFQNIESERFVTTVRSYEEFFEDIAILTLKLSRQMFNDSKIDVTITAESKKFIEKIKWSEVDLEDDKFVTRIYSSALFPTQPAAKLQKIEEYVRAGWMNREDAIAQMDSPDTEAWETLETADKTYAEKIIGTILGEGKYLPPEPEMSLVNAINAARKAYLEALTAEAPEDRLELLLRWIEAASSLLPEIATPATPSVGPVAGTPMAAPESGLLPQTVPGV